MGSFCFLNPCLGILSVFGIKEVARFLRAVSVVQIDSEPVSVDENINPIKDIEQINLAAIRILVQIRIKGLACCLKVESRYLF